jgi:ABC-type branched-subunit amino acid transport system permease subunit
VAALPGWADGRWKPILVAVAVLNLLCAPVSWIDEGLTPSWVVYPIALLVGLWRLRVGGRTGTIFLGVAALVFLLVHLPWTWASLFGDENPLNPDREFSPLQWFLTLFVAPLLLLAVAALAHRESRTGRSLR